MSYRLVIVDCNHEYFDPEIKTACKYNTELIVLAGKNLTRDEIISFCVEADAIIVQRFVVNARFLDALQRCKVITRYGVGLDNLDVDEIQRRCIEIVYFPGFCTEEVANHTVAALLWLYRSLDLCCGKSLLNSWGNPQLFRSIKSSSITTVGILGLGRIGSRVSKILNTCGFQVIANDPYIKKSRFQMSNALPVDKSTLFSQSDILSLHVPLTSETKNILNQQVFDVMKKECLLINTARGGVIHVPSLFDALHNKKIAAAFVDVCNPEPPTEEWFSIPNLYLSNHCAFYSEESLSRLKTGVIEQTVRKLDELLGN